MEKILHMLYTQEGMRAMQWRKKIYYYFLLAKYIPVSQKYWPKMGMAIPYCLCWKLLHTKRKYSDMSNLFAELQHAKAKES